MSFESATAIVAITTGTWESPRLVCIGHVTPNMPVLGQFATDDLDMDESCVMCGKVYNPSPSYV